MTEKRSVRVLVLGGTGSMGAYLVKDLVDLGYKVVVTSRTERHSNERDLVYIKGDAKDDNFLNSILTESRYDAVVDFMLYTTEEFKLRYKNILKNTSHYLYLSSYRVYGKSDNQVLSEDFPRLIDTLKDEKYLSTDEYALAKARQEDLLINSGENNWTILRPAITYSKDRFFLGSAGTDGFLYRALNGKSLIFPKEILDKVTTMTWAGDAARMIALLVGNNEAFGEVVNISTAEHRTWSEVVDYYRKYLDVKIKTVSMPEYVRIYKLKYMMKYNRMYNRLVDNTKVLKLTGMNQHELMPLEDGLRMELSAFSQSPKYGSIDKKRERMIDSITTTKVQKIRSKIKPRTRLKQVKSIAMSLLKYDGAIVTLTVYNNYGNVIQRYALQKFLANHGYTFNMLDLHKSKINKYHKKIKKFADRYLDQDTFNPKVAKYYKTYIVGSDQVWRHFSVNRKWKNFGIQFLDFVTSNRTNRIAYAASFGVDSFEAADIDEKRKAKIKPLMEKFNHISVREKSAMGMVKELGGVSSDHVLDPTFLLPVSDYDALIASSKFKDKKSAPVFYYLIDPTPLIQSTIEYYEQKTNSKSVGVLPYLHPYRGIDLPTMEYWLKSIRDADIVIADSYHAVVFSIIFHTDFIVFDKKGGGLARIAELLEPLGLGDRIVIQGNKSRYNEKHKPIDWKKVDKELNKKRSESSDWLINAIGKPDKNKV